MQRKADVDAISDGSKRVIAGILEYIEQAGVHSGDSACILPHKHFRNILGKMITKLFLKTQNCWIYKYTICHKR